MVIDYLEVKDYLVFITETAFRKLIRDNSCKFLDAQGSPRRTHNPFV